MDIKTEYEEGYNHGALIDYMIFDGKHNGEFRAYEGITRKDELIRNKLKEHKIFKDGAVAVDLMLCKYTPAQISEIARNLGVELIPPIIKLKEIKDRCDVIAMDCMVLDDEISNIISKKDLMIAEMDKLGEESTYLISISGMSIHDVCIHLGVI